MKHALFQASGNVASTLVLTYTWHGARTNKKKKMTEKLLQQFSPYVEGGLSEFLTRKTELKDYAEENKLTTYII